MKESEPTDDEIMNDWMEAKLFFRELDSSPPVMTEDVCKCHGVRRVNKGTHMSCRVKHREQNLRAVKRYQRRAKGMLQRVRDEAKQRGTQ